MFKASFKGEWFGVLQTKSDEVVVVYDSVLPKAAPGKIYLYNTAKDRIIEYVIDIVKPKVKQLKEAPLQQAKSKYGDSWLSAKQLFLAEKGIYVESEKGQGSGDVENKIDEILSDLDEDTVAIEDEFEDL